MAGEAETALREIVGTGELKVKVENRPRNEPPPSAFEVLVTVVAAGAGLEAFDRIVAAIGTGWNNREDEGWRCDFEWRRDLAEGVFLVPAAAYAWR